jgi:hypothetical protein
MKPFYPIVHLIWVLYLLPMVTSAQVKSIYSKWNYYTHETSGLVIIEFEGNPVDGMIDAVLLHHDDTIAAAKIALSRKTYVPFKLESVPNGTHLLTAMIVVNGQEPEEKYVEVRKLPPADNEVKIDLETGGLVVDGLPFFPFGFYCSSPVGTLPEEEVVRGFNMIGPYQNNLPETLEERKAYMDRCAALGVKVHYGINGLVGMGHNQEKAYDRNDPEKMALLKSEILAFRDHPALLAWYLNDEPLGQSRPPHLVEEAYDLVRELDPYHPISIVFMMPYRANEFRNAMDIAMTDPYPIPGSMDKVWVDVDHLNRHFANEKSVWLVPQAFGGGEFWRREPTGREIRVMTYMGLVRGATGIQYFLRRPPNLFPKSVESWNACSNMALEVAEIAPYLLSDEAKPTVNVQDESLLVNGWRHNGKVLVMAVNKDKQPKAISIEVSDLKGSPSEASVLFENRRTRYQGNQITDMIDGYGTRVYLLAESKASEEHHVFSSNLMINPSFEEMPSLGVPSGCYAGYSSKNGDPGATYFVDPRTSMHGDHSLRLITPSDSGGIKLSFYQIPLISGSSYSVSIWAKAWDASDHPRFRLAVSRTPFEKVFRLNDQWQQYHFSFSVEEAPFRPGITLELLDAGIAWFDLLQASPDPIINYVIKSTDEAEVQIASVAGSADLRYRMGRKGKFKPYKKPLTVGGYKTIEAGIYENNVLKVKTAQRIPVSKAWGKKVQYLTAYSSKYPGDGDQSLTDGVLGTTAFRDGRWLGYEGNNVEIIIDLEKSISINRIEANFLSDVRDGIHPPLKTTVLTSTDGKNFMPRAATDRPGAPRHNESYMMPFIMSTDAIRARYVKLIAESVGEIPGDYLFKGTKAWTFIDEIIIE